jgi:hypothetical protein
VDRAHPLGRDAHRVAGRLIHGATNRDPAVFAERVAGEARGERGPEPAAR